MRPEDVRRIEEINPENLGRHSEYVNDWLAAGWTFLAAGQRAVQSDAGPRLVVYYSVGWAEPGSPEYPPHMSSQARREAGLDT